MRVSFPHLSFGHLRPTQQKAVGFEQTYSPQQLQSTLSYRGLAMEMKLGAMERELNPKKITWRAKSAENEFIRRLEWLSQYKGGGMGSEDLTEAVLMLASDPYFRFNSKLMEALKASAQHLPIHRTEEKIQWDRRH